MAGPGLEIICTECGQESLLRREPVYEGLRKTGESLICSACGHVYGDPDAVPYKETGAVRVFCEDDKSRKVNVFGDDERQRNCRYCRHYVVNPFTQWCGFHSREVKATDLCGDFDRAAEDEPEAGDEGDALSGLFKDG